jgi:hypothetical protein
MKNTRSLLILAVTVAAALGPQSVVAVTSISYTLTLTENSSTSLSLAYTGPSNSFSTPSNTGPDMWSIQVLSQTISLNDFEFAFSEPESTATINTVSHSTDVNADMMFVESDVLLATYTSGNVITGQGPTIGSDGGVPIQLVFNDVAAAAEAAVPESGFTLGLFAVALTALFGVKRLRVARVA